jgi:hypothetical protein
MLFFNFNQIVARKCRRAQPHFTRLPERPMPPVYDPIWPAPTYRDHVADFCTVAEVGSGKAGCFTYTFTPYTLTPLFKNKGIQRRAIILTKYNEPPQPNFDLRCLNLFSSSSVGSVVTPPPWTSSMGFAVKMVLTMILRIQTPRAPSRRCGKIPIER